MVNLFCAFALILIVTSTKSADVRKNPLLVKVHDNANDPILCDKVEELIFADSVPYISFHQVQSTLNKDIKINSEIYQKLKTESIEKIQQKQLLSYAKIMNVDDIVAPLKTAEPSLTEFAVNIEKDKLSADCFNRLTAHRKRLEKIVTATKPSGSIADRMGSPQLSDLEEQNRISVSEKNIVICFHYNNDNPLTYKYSFKLEGILENTAKTHAVLAFQQYAGNIRFTSKKNTDKDNIATSLNGSCNIRYIFQEDIPLPFQYERDIDGLVQVMKANIINLIIGDNPSPETIKEFYKKGYLYDIGGMETAVIYNNKKLVSFVSYTSEYGYYSNKSHIILLATDESVRKKGYGSSLVRYALNLFKNRGADGATIQTTNPIALRLYKAIGFQVTGQRYNTYYLRFLFTLKNLSLSQWIWHKLFVRTVVI